MKKRRIFSFILALCLLTGLMAGCKAKPKPVTSSTAPITFTAFSSDSTQINQWGDDPISKEITKETGVTLKMQYLVGDLSTKLGVMSAGGDLPDMLLSIQNTDLAKLISAGQVVSLDNYITKDGVNVKKVFGNEISYNKQSDGHIYGFERTWNSHVAQTNFDISYAMLKDAGYPKITTLDDLYNLMLNYKQKNPTFNGLKTVGLEFWGDSYGWSNTINNPALAAGGYQNDGDYVVDPTTHQAQYGVISDAAKTYFKWLNKLYNSGLLDPDAFIQKRDNYIAKVSKGNVLVCTDPQWDLGDAEAALRKNNMDGRCYAKMPIYDSQETAATSQISNYDPSGSWESVITTSCKNPERAFQFFDTMWSEKMQTLANWGIEGTDYTVNSSGKRVFNANVMADHATLQSPQFGAKYGVGEYYYWSEGDGVKDSTGNYVTPWSDPALTAATYTAADNEVLHTYNKDAVIWSDLFPAAKPSSYGYAWSITLPSDSAGAIAETKVKNQIRVSDVPVLAMSKNDTAFETNWNKLVSD